MNKIPSEFKCLQTLFPLILDEYVNRPLIVEKTKAFLSEWIRIMNSSHEMSLHENAGKVSNWVCKVQLFYLTLENENIHLARPLSNIFNKIKQAVDSHIFLSTEVLKSANVLLAKNEETFTQDDFEFAFTAEYKMRAALTNSSRVLPDVHENYEGVFLPLLRKTKKFLSSNKRPNQRSIKFCQKQGHVIGLAIEAMCQSVKSGLIFNRSEVGSNKVYLLDQVVFKEFRKFGDFSEESTRKAIALSNLTSDNGVLTTVFFKALQPHRFGISIVTQEERLRGFKVSEIKIPQDWDMLQHIASRFSQKNDEVLWNLLFKNIATQTSELTDYDKVKNLKVEVDGEILLFPEFRKRYLAEIYNSDTLVATVLKMGKAQRYLLIDVMKQDPVFCNALGHGAQLKDDVGYYLIPDLPSHMLEIYKYLEGLQWQYLNLQQQWTKLTFKQLHVLWMQKSITLTTHIALDTNGEVPCRIKNYRISSPTHSMYLHKLLDCKWRFIAGQVHALHVRTSVSQQNGRCIERRDAEVKPIKKCSASPFIKDLIILHNVASKIPELNIIFDSLTDETMLDSILIPTQLQFFDYHAHNIGFQRTKPGPNATNPQSYEFSYYDADLCLGEDNSLSLYSVQVTPDSKKRKIHAKLPTRSALYNYNWKYQPLKPSIIQRLFDRAEREKNVKEWVYAYNSAIRNFIPKNKFDELDEWINKLWGDEKYSLSSGQAGTIESHQMRFALAISDIANYREFWQFIHTLLLEGPLGRGGWYKQYIVKQGETIEDLTLKLYVTKEDLLELNKDRLPLVPGRSLLIKYNINSEHPLPTIERIIIARQLAMRLTYRQYKAYKARTDACHSLLTDWLELTVRQETDLENNLTWLIDLLNRHPELFSVDDRNTFLSKLTNTKGKVNILKTPQAQLTLRRQYTSAKRKIIKALTPSYFTLNAKAFPYLFEQHKMYESKRNREIGIFNSIGDYRQPLKNEIALAKKSRSKKVKAAAENLERLVKRKLSGTSEVGGPPAKEFYLGN